MNPYYDADGIRLVGALSKDDLNAVKAVVTERRAELGGLL